MNTKRMAKTAVTFAIKHKISLGQDCRTGHYYIVDHTSHVCMFGQRVSEVSNQPTAKSAVAMMRRHLRKQEGGAT